MHASSIQALASHPAEAPKKGVDTAGAQAVAQMYPEVNYFRRHLLEPLSQAEIVMAGKH